MLPCFPIPVFQGSRALRAMVSADIPRIMEIDKECFEPPVTEEEINLNLTDPNFFWRVLEVDGEIVAYHMYRFRSNDVFILRIGTALNHRRKGYASLLMKEAYRKLTTKRNKLICLVNERNDTGIFWLKKLGFQWTNTRKNGSLDESDAYSFRLVLIESIVK